MTEGLPSVVCPSWCEKSDGHTNVHHANDHRCVSESRTVSVSRHPLVDDATEPRAPDKLVGFIHREAGESVPHIRLDHNDTPIIDLSVDDALRLAAELRSLTEGA